MAEEAQAEVDTATEAKHETFMVLIKKAMRKIEVDPEKVPPHLFRQIWLKGCEEVLNLKMSKHKLSPKSLKELDEGSEADKQKSKEAKDAAFKQGEKNLEELYAGTFKLGKSGATDADGAKLSREVNTEAMRVARGHVKDWLRDQKIPISHVPASKITESAKALLEQNPHIIEEAKATIAAKAAKAPTVAIKGLNPNEMADPTLVKKAKARNEERKAKGKDSTEKVLSAAQSGKLKVTPRPQVQPEAHTRH